MLPQVAWVKSFSNCLKLWHETPTSKPSWRLNFMREFGVHLTQGHYKKVFFVEHWKTSLIKWWTAKIAPKKMASAPRKKRGRRKRWVFSAENTRDVFCGMTKENKHIRCLENWNYIWLIHQLASLSKLNQTKLFLNLILWTNCSVCNICGFCLFVTTHTQDLRQNPKNTPLNVYKHWARHWEAPATKRCDQVKVIPNSGWAV